jgi:general stress protein YciG
VLASPHDSFEGCPAGAHAGAREEGVASISGRRDRAKPVPPFGVRGRQRLEPVRPITPLAGGTTHCRVAHLNFREKSLRYDCHMFEPAEAQFRRRMLDLARRGGAATERLAATEQNYYASIGRLGGRASVAARKAKIAAEAKFQPADAPMSAESAQASFPPAGPEAAEGAAVIPQPIEARDSFTQAFSGSYAQGRRIAELLAELLDDTSDEAP